MIICNLKINVEETVLQAVTMPKQGLTMEEGKIIRWHKEEGDTVHQGEILFEIETDKAVLEIEAEYTGILKKILASPGTIVKITEPIAYIGDKDDVVPDE